MSIRKSEITETVRLTTEEMDIVFEALLEFGKAGVTILDRAVKMKAEDVAMAQTKFNKWIEELRNKFLHE